MVGGLLELTLHCQHETCHNLRMTPSHPLSASGTYGKKAEDLGGTVLVASTRFPVAGWWYASIESVDKQVYEFTLQARVFCSGFCNVAASARSKKRTACRSARANAWPHTAATRVPHD